MQARIDLVADLGEGFGDWTMGNDASLLEIVTSANVACGFHAGDPRIMDATARACAERGIQIGAHPQAERGRPQHVPAAGRRTRGDHGLAPGDSDRARWDVRAGTGQPRHRTGEPGSVHHRCAGRCAEAADQQRFGGVPGDHLAGGQVEVDGDRVQVGAVVAAVGDRDLEGARRPGRDAVDAIGELADRGPDRGVVGAAAVELDQQRVVGGQGAEQPVRLRLPQQRRQAVRDPPGRVLTGALDDDPDGGIPAVEHW